MNLPHYLRDRPALTRPNTSATSEAMSVRSKFGHAPPPPLPGMAKPRSSTSVSPNRGVSSPGENLLRTGRSLPQSPKQLAPSTDVPILIETGPSPPASPASSEATQDSLHIVDSIKDAMDNTHLSTVAEANDGLQHGRRSACATPSPSPWSSCPGSTTSSIYSSSYFPSPQSSAHPALAPGGSGYDSPASEFYESGSEYDLIC